MIIGIPSTTHKFWFGTKERKAYPIGGVIARPLLNCGERAPWVRLKNEKKGRRICFNEIFESIEMRSKEDLEMAVDEEQDELQTSVLTVSIEARIIIDLPGTGSIVQKKSMSLRFSDARR